MTALALHMVQDLPATLTGVGAALCLTAAPMFRQRRKILSTQFAAALCFSVHYLYLGITVAAAANMLAMVQISAALLSARSTAMRWLGYALIGVMALAGLLFWQGPISAFSMIAMSLVALARMQTNEIRLRLLLLGGGCFWVTHDLVGEAWFALAADLGALAMGLSILFSLLFRVTIEWRPSASMAPAAQA